MSAQPRVELPDFSELVERVGPAVVNIRVSEKVRGGVSVNGIPEEMLEQFRRFGLPIPNQRRGALRGVTMTMARLARASAPASSSAAMAM